MGLGVGALGLAQGQGILPDPPAGFSWASQGVQVYADSGSFTVDLGTNGVTDVVGQEVLDESIQLTAFDATPGSNEYVQVHSSTYSVSLNGLGSVVLINLNAADVTIGGQASFTGWSIGGVAGAGPGADSLSHSGYFLGGGSAGLFDDGSGTSSLSVILADSGAAPTGGEMLDFDFDGTYDLDFDALIGPAGTWFASGSARGEASVQTVYERFTLVTVPEPSVLLLAATGLLVGLRRKRA
jgi:hypothetical protein